MSLASYHDGKTEVWKYSGMVSDQAVLHPAPPHEGFGRFAPSAIVGLMRNSLSEALPGNPDVNNGVYEVFFVISQYEK